jgi:hypothetical protein
LQLAACDALLWVILWAVVVSVEPVSRRSANLAYGLWMLAYNLLIVVVFLLGDILLGPVTLPMVDAGECCPLPRPLSRFASPLTDTFDVLDTGCLTHALLSLSLEVSFPAARVERIRASPPHRPTRAWLRTTLQTLQEPILLLPWLCFRGGGFPNLDLSSVWCPLRSERAAAAPLPPSKHSHRSRQHLHGYNRCVREDRVGGDAVLPHAAGVCCGCSTRA